MMELFSISPFGPCHALGYTLVFYSGLQSLYPGEEYSNTLEQLVYHELSPINSPD